MSQNYNINPQFGSNVSINGSKSAVQKQNINPEQPSINLFKVMANYIDKYEDVLNGSVERQINGYINFMQETALNLKNADKGHRRFDTTI